MRKLVEVATRLAFDNLNLSDYQRSIVFIKDTKEIWTHNTFYTGLCFYTNVSKSVNLSTSWTPLLALENLNESGTYVVQLYYGGVYYSGIFSFSKYTGNSSTFVDEEISLHASGNNSSNNARIYLKLGLNSKKETIFIAASKDDGLAMVDLKIKQIL